MDDQTDEDNLVDDTIKEQEKADTGASRATQKLGEKTKGETKKALKKYKEAAKKGKYSKGFGKVLYYLIPILIIIIMVIGFISFGLNMPGLVKEKVSGFFRKIFNIEDEAKIKAEKLEMLNYISEMGYDPVTMGLAYSVSRDPEGKIYDFSTELEIDEGNEFVQKSSALLEYLMYANERMYQTKESSGLERIFGTDPLVNEGKGMLNIYGDDLKTFDSWDLDRDNLKLTFKNTNGFFKTDVFQYDIDGWAGRYGTPLELLLAIHTSTMMPDLVEEFITNSNLQTMVNIEAQEVELDLDVKISQIGEDGKKQEKIINVGDPNSTEELPIHFNQDGSEITYDGDLQKDLEDNKISLFKIYKTFKKYETTGNDYWGSESDNDRLKRIKDFLSEESKYMYIVKTASELISSQYEIQYLGNAAEENGSGIKLNEKFNILENAGKLITGKVTGEDGNYTLTYTIEKDNMSEDYEGKTYTASILKIAKPTYYYQCLKEENKVIEGYNNFETINGIDWNTYIGYKDIMVQLIGNYVENIRTVVTVDNYPTITSYSNLTWSIPKSQEQFSGTAEYETIKTELKRQISEASGGHDNREPSADEIYREYLTRNSTSLSTVLENINEDIIKISNQKEKASQLKQWISNNLGIDASAINEICELFKNNQTSIKTYVPTIQSVIKHWYKDVIFKYTNAKKGTIFTSTYTGENGTDCTIEYEFTVKDDNYPVQDGEPYIIKGDIVTRNGEDVEYKDVSIDKGTELILSEEDGYKLGEGYKTARKLFTQGYYYQYDGTIETANEIKNAKIIEAYAEKYGSNKLIKVAVKNGKLDSVRLPEDTNTYVKGDYVINYIKTEVVQIEVEENGEKKKVENTSSTTLYSVKCNMYNDIQEPLSGDISKIGQANQIYKIYYINPPETAYISPVSKKGLEDLKNTEDSVDRINSCLKSLGTALRRKKVNIINTSTSLAALSMLESMHTLDGEYVYREFKEFMIELGYYSRAELEAVERDVLDWIIPGFTPDNWPPINTDKEMLEFGTTLLSTSNVPISKTISADKVKNLDNFIIFSDVTGAIQYTTLSEAGKNVDISIQNLTIDGIVSKIKQKENTVGICIYLTKDTSTDYKKAAENTAELIKGIREKLKKEGCVNYEMPIFMLQVLPPQKPIDILVDSGNTEEQIQIANYNVQLLSICSGQKNVKYINVAKGCIDEQGWLAEGNTSKKVAENIVSKIVKKNVSNGGFDENLKVTTPGAGYITKIEFVEEENINVEGNKVTNTVGQITIEFSVDVDPALLPVDGFTMVIRGISIDEELKAKFDSSTEKDKDENKILKIEKGEVLGVTTTSNIKIVFRDKNKGIINNIEDYMPLISRFNIPIELEQTIQVVWGFEGISGGDGSGYYTVVNPGNGDSLTVGHGITNGVSGIFEELGYGEYIPLKEGDKIPVEVIDAVSLKKLENTVNEFKQKAEDDGITLLDQEIAALTVFNYQNPAGSNKAYGLIVEGNYNELREYWLNANKTKVEGSAKESVEDGITLRRCVEWDIFETGNMEFSHERKDECYQKYEQYIEDKIN